MTLEEMEKEFEEKFCYEMMNFDHTNRHHYIIPDVIEKPQLIIDWFESKLKQEIEEYHSKVINAFERYLRSGNGYAKDNWTVNQIVKFEEDAEYCKSVYNENRLKMNFDDAHDLARTKLFEKILKEILMPLPESPEEKL